MAAEEIAAAKAVIKSDAIRSVLRQTTNAIVKGAIGGIIMGGLLLCLECGLLYAEGKITWKQLVDKVVKAGALAGLSAFIITGLIVGLNILFPLFIPMMAPVLFVLQIVSLVFLAHHALKIAEGWWKVSKDHDLLNVFDEVLEKVQDFVHEMVDDTENNVLSVVWEWVEELARRVGIERAWGMAIGFFQRLGIDNAWSWFAAQTQAVKEQASVLASSLKKWEFPDLNIDVDEIQEAIANVINIEFKDALMATDEIRRSISDYLNSAGREGLEIS